MDEITLLSLIARGENKEVDFKEKLPLTSKQEKAEFVKDLVSLANSSSDAGYLLIGVNDDKYIVGSEPLPDERIQLIASTYITPALDLMCFNVPMTTPTLPLVGVIQVRATKKPHKIARAIGHLHQDDVFVRRGSIVVKASPDEIIRMHTATTRTFFSAQTSTEVDEKQMRFNRVKANRSSWKEREEDLRWLRKNTSGVELGEVLFWEVKGWEARDIESVGKDAKALLDQSIELGFDNSEVYYLRAEANGALCNYGLALQDINTALEKASDQHSMVKYVALKIDILLAMRKFKDAARLIAWGRSNNEDELRSWLGGVGSESFEDVFRKYLLLSQFGSWKLHEPFKTALIAWALWNGRQLREIIKYSPSDIRIKTGLDSLEEEIPGTRLIIRDVLGEKLWELMVNDDEISLTHRFQRVRDQLPSDY